jgi:hypothetical protein
MDTDVASALPVKTGSHSSMIIAMNFLAERVMLAVWQSTGR